ncbi:MAG TPA: hypothetical protein VF781_09035 [Solirubrobacteraceae bacterium]
MLTGHSRPVDTRTLVSGQKGPWNTNPKGGPFMAKKFRLILTSGVVATAFAIPVGSASADPNGYCGSSANGCAAAQAAGAQCGSGAASGAFGAFGPGNNFAGGADGYQTGLNNSAVCGNR